MVTLRFRRTNDSQARNEFSAIQDAQACKSWLSTVVPADTPDNLRRIAECIGEVMEGPLAPARKFEILDRIRVVLYGLMRERVRDPEFRAVPLMGNEAEPAWALIDTVEDLREGFELLIPRLGDAPREAGLPAQQPGRDQAVAPLATKVMALHRALDCNAQVLVLYQRLRVAVPDRLWDQHCRMGQLARQLGVSNDEVEDPLHASLTETCREAFNVPLLIALADPTMLAPAEFLAAYACALRWAAKVGFRIDSAAELGSPPTRPANNPGPVVQLASNEHQVRLDTQRVLKSVERRVGLLDEGNTPHSLGLGDAISVSASRTLLHGLMRRWGTVMPESIDFPEQLWRPSPSEFGLAAIGAAQVRDGPHRTTATSASNVVYDYTRARDDALTRARGDIERAQLDRMLDESETWSVVGELPDSVLCMRRQVRPRLNLGQLIGLKLGGKAGPIPFLLGSVQGLQQGIDDNSRGVARPALNHLVRVKLIAGLPLAVRAALDQVEIEPAYLMSPNAAPGDEDIPIWDRVRAAPESYALVLPAASFRPARTLRVVADGLATVLRLDGLVQRGLDFDHVQFRLV